MDNRARTLSTFSMSIFPTPIVSPQTANTYNSVRRWGKIANRTHVGHLLLAIFPPKTSPPPSAYTSLPHF